MTTLPPPYAELRTSSSRLRFYRGDCLDLLPRLEPGSVSAVVTSPPYNLGIRYRSYDDRLPREQYLDWTRAWVGAVVPAIHAQGSLFLNVGSKPRDPWVALDIAQVVRPYLELQNTIHWVKSIVIERNAAGAAAGLTRDLAVGHYKPINSDRYLNDCHEFIFHFTPRGTTRLDRRAIGVPYQDHSNIARWKAAAGGVRCRGNAWFLPYETINSRERDRPHPATYPERLPEYCLRLHGLDRVSLVIDPFLGLGSTAVACAALGLTFVGIDIDEGYLDEAVERTRRRLESPGAMPSRTARRGSRKLPLLDDPD